LGSLGRDFWRTTKVSGAGSFALASPELVEPALVPEVVAPEPLLTTVVPESPESAVFDDEPPLVDLAGFDAVVLSDPAGLVVEPLEVVVDPDDDALPEPLVTTGVGFATGTGSVTRLVAPLLDVDVFVGAAARLVPTVFAVTGRRTVEVLGARGLGGVGAAPPVGAALPDDPLASMPAARASALGVAGAFGTTGGGATFGALVTGCWGTTGAGAVGDSFEPGAAAPAVVVAPAAVPVEAVVAGFVVGAAGATGAGFAAGATGAVGVFVAGAAGALGTGSALPLLGTEVGVVLSGASTGGSGFVPPAVPAEV
jgi:hypothetical protein